MLIWFFRSGFEEAAEDVLEDAAVPVVVGLGGGVDSDSDVKLLVSVFAGGGDAEGFSVSEAGGVGGGESVDGEGFVSGEAEGLGGFSGLELEGEDAHADEVAAVDTLE